MKNSIILTTIAAVLAWALFKVNNLMNAGKKIKVLNPQVYSTRLNLQGKILSFKLDVDLANPSNEKFNIQPLFIDAFSIDHKFLARAQPPQQKFTLKPQSTHSMKGVLIEIPTANIQDIIFNGLRQQISLDIFLRVNGFEMKLTQLVTFNI